MDPKCKSAVITGGISGIGLAVASHLLHVGGRQVVVFGRNCCKGKEAESFLNKNYGRNKAAFMKVNLHDLKETEGDSIYCLFNYKKHKFFSLQKPLNALMII